MSDLHYERRRRSFERIADAYDRCRPYYPDEIFEAIRSYADLAAGDDRILELGCGPGRATKHLAQWPNRVTALDPSEAMADIARLNLASHDNVEILTSSFEEWELEPNTFGLVLVAQAWHWLDEDTRIDRVADALYAHGTAAIMGNIQVVTGETLPFYERANEVYRKHAPGHEHQGAFATADDIPPHPLEGSSRFYDHQQVAHEWNWTLPTEDYIAKLGTHSNHAALEDDVRKRLHDGIAELVDDEFGGSVTEHYVALVGLARRAH